MATVTKDFKVKNGLIVEGTTATVNNHDILTKKQDDQDYIVGLIGGTSTSANTPNSVVKRDGSGDFAAGTITADLVGDVTGNADTATALETARTISLAGDVTGSVSFDGTANVSITATIDGSFATDAEVATAKSEAIADAATYTDGRETAITTAYQTYADQAETDAKAYADSLAVNYDAAGSAATAEANAISAAETYTDTAVANLVDSAPATLDTLNELAAALQDNPDIITDLQTIAAGKQDALTAGSNISIDGSNVISVTGLTSAEISDFNTAALSATSAAYDPAGSAATAESNANSYTDGEITTVNNTINALTTDDVAEGTAEYFTDAKAKTSAAQLLTTATLTNIQITGDGSGLTITAENGVADSTTADLAEDPSATGSSGTMYFTDARAVSALEAVVPNFTAVEVNSVAKQVAASAEVATASTNTALSWLKADYRSAEFLVKIAQGTHTEVSKVVLTLDTSDNVAITEYAMVGTNGSLGSVSADVSGTDVRLRVTTDNNTSTVTVVGTLLA